LCGDIDHAWKHGADAERSERWDQDSVCDGPDKRAEFDQSSAREVNTTGGELTMIVLIDAR